MVQPTSAPLTAAAEALDLAQMVVDAGCDAVRAHGGVDANQVVAYDLAHSAAAVATARATLTYGALGETEELLATAFVADVLGEYMASSHRDDALLISYDDRLGNRTVFKRLGYLIEHRRIER